MDGEGKTELASAYARAGVDLSVAQAALRGLRPWVESTQTPRVLARPGLFAGFFAYPAADSERLLVASMDGVGTKMRIASLLGRFRGVGYDIVGHCVNDILVHGATPLFFLDYIGTGRLSAQTVAELVEGMAKGCVESGCALLGGETAEMPGIYAEGDWDLVGTIVGEVRRDRLVDGAGIRPGDRILGLRSLGLHTNGYSLARRALDVEARPAVLHETVPGGDETWGDALLAPHRMYLELVRPILEEDRLRAGVRGMVHLTGGGFQENLPRVLPEGCRAAIDRSTWTPPPVFRALRERAALDDEEAYRVLNMGLGYLLVVARETAPAIARRLEAAGERPVEIGRIEVGTRGVRWAEGGTLAAEAS